MPAETKISNTTVYLEHSIFILLESLTTREDVSKSSYIRSLIIDDLRKRGMVSDEALVQIAV